MTETPVIRGRALNAVGWIEATGQGRVLAHGLPTLVTAGRPAGLDPLPRRFESAERYVAPRRYLAELPGAVVSGPEGMVITADGCLLEDLGRLGHRSIDAHPIWNSGHEPPNITLPGVTAVLANPGADRNVCHFLADSLPRAATILEAGVPVDNWLVSGAAHGWQQDGLAAVLPAASHVVCLDEIETVRTETLIVPARTGFAIATAPWARDAIHARLPVESVPRTRRLVVSRRRATRRRLLNEDEMFDALRPMGFERVAFESYPLLEQLALVASAQILVGVHGAAFGHLIAAPPGGHLVEILNPAEPHPEYFILARISGWDYTAAIGEVAATADQPIHHDLRIDPGAIAKIVLSIVQGA